MKASREVLEWIDGLSDTELLELRFAPNGGWCRKIRATLRRLAGADDQAAADSTDPDQQELEPDPAELPGVW